MDYDKSVWLLDNRNASDEDYIKILNDDIVKVYGTFKASVLDIKTDAEPRISDTIKYAN